MAAPEKTNWKVYGKRSAGELIGTQPATLAHKIKKMGIKNPLEETEYHYSVIHMK